MTGSVGVRVRLHSHRMLGAGQDQQGKSVQVPEPNAEDGELFMQSLLDCGLYHGGERLLAVAYGQVTLDEAQGMHSFAWLVL